MWSPWRELRDRHPDWDVRFVALPEGYDGLTDFRHRIVWMAQELNQAQRRSCLAHELVHIEHGHDGPCCDQVERGVELIAARALISIEALCRVLAWTSIASEASEELHVDETTLTTRLRHMHPSERAALLRVLRRKGEAA